MRIVFGLIMGLFIVGVILEAMSIVVGISFKNVNNAANMTGVGAQVTPFIISFGNVFQIVGGLFILAPFILFAAQLLYDKGYIGGGGQYYQ
jgi:hypothetical protein